MTTALARLGIFPLEAVVKVDSTVCGIGEGLSAGVWTVAVYGSSNYTNVDSMEVWNSMSEGLKQEARQNSLRKLLGSGAHYVVECLADLPGVCNDINARLEKGEKPHN